MIINQAVIRMRDIALINLEVEKMQMMIIMIMKIILQILIQMIMIIKGKIKKNYI